MSYSADVSILDDMLATQYNNLRKDTINTAGHTHSGAADDGRKVYRNVANVRLADDYNTSSASWLTRTGASVTITTVNIWSGGYYAPPCVILQVRSTWKLPKLDAYLRARISRDSGAEYINLGAIMITGGDTNSFLIAYLGGVVGFPQGASYLSAGDHTFALEVKLDHGGDAGYIAYNNCSGDDGALEMIAEEVHALY